MFAHKEIPYKICRPTCSEIRLDIFWHESTVNTVCIFSKCFECIIHSICADFALQKLLLFCNCTMPCAYQSKFLACVRVKMSRMSVKDLTVLCNWKKKNEAKISKVSLHWSLPSGRKTNMFTLWLFPKFYVFFSPIVCLVQL